MKCGLPEIADRCHNRYRYFRSSDAQRQSVGEVASQYFPWRIFSGHPRECTGCEMPSVIAEERASIQPEL